MYKCLLILIVSFLSINAEGQDYLPIHEEGKNTKFQLVHEMSNGANSPNAFFNGKSNIDGLEYYLISILGFEGLVDIGYIRQSENFDKAWFLGINDDQEYLIMDLNLELGDEFYVKFEPLGESMAKVTSVDEIDGRKKITLDYEFGGIYFYEYLTFIEGVGPNAFFNFQIDDVNNPIAFDLGFLTCKKFVNDSLSFHLLPDLANCLDLVEIQNLVTIQDLIISPNPSNGQFSVKLPNDRLFLAPLSYKIINFTGQTVKTGNIRNSAVELELEQSGLFFLIIDDHGKKLMQKRIMVQP